MIASYTGVIIGALLGFLASIGSQLIMRLVDRRGKLFVYVSRTYVGSFCWGFYDNGCSVNLSIPTAVELQNTSNATRVIRSIQMALYRSGARVATMHQVEGITATKKHNSDIVKEVRYPFGGDNSSYSFVLPPRSIQKQKLEFDINCKKIETEKMAFDELRVEYYDERNDLHSCHFINMNGDWRPIKGKNDEDWVLLSERRKLRKSDC